MKIVHATWEKRNLGCEAYEITLEKKDLRDFEATYNEIEAQNFKNAYVVIKMPVGDLRALHKLEDEGFRFMENQICLRKDFDSYEMPTYIRRFENFLKCHIATYEESKALIGMISERMFITDRFFLDPFFSEKTSARRYVNWLYDLIGSENIQMLSFRLTKNDAVVGFALHKKDDKNSYIGVLSGLYPDAPNGIGAVFFHEHFSYLYEQGAKAFYATISSNNLPMFKIYSQFNTTVLDEKYVLRKLYTL